MHNRNDDGIREALEAIGDALNLVGGGVDAEILEEAFMALDYLCKVLFRNSTPTTVPTVQDNDQRIYELTRKAVSADATEETVAAVLREFEQVVAQTGSSLPIGKAIYIFENSHGNLPVERLLLFLEDAYNFAPGGSDVRTQMTKYLFQLLWKFTR